MTASLPKLHRAKSLLFGGTAFSGSGRQQDPRQTAAAEAEKYVEHSVAHLPWRSAILSGAVMMNGPSTSRFRPRIWSARPVLSGDLRLDVHPSPGTFDRILVIQTNGPRGGLLPRPAKAPEPGHGTNAFVCSIEVTDFDATAKKITGLGGKVALPKFAVPGVCWQGYFLDTEGNTFGIFQPDPTSR